MKALVVDALGVDGQFGWRDHPEPELLPGGVLVAVTAVAVDWADVLQREGKYPDGPVAPYVSGSGFAGSVIESDTASLPTGTRVFGMHPVGSLWGAPEGSGPGGAAAEIISVQGNLAFATPSTLTDVQAAGIIGQFLTAYAATKTFGRVSPPDNVLVHAGAGSFGSAAIQLCRAYGPTTVIGTAGSQRKLDFMADLGATHVINYNEEPFHKRVLEITGTGTDVIIDSVGGETLDASFDCIAPFGRIISVGASSGRGSKRLRLHTLLMGNISIAGLELGVMMRDMPLFQASMAELIAMFERGEIRSIVGGEFPVADAVRAHEHMKSRANVGRTVLSLA